MMVEFQKDIVNAKETRKKKKFKRFAIDYRGAFVDENTLVASDSKNCFIVDDAITTGETLTPYRPDGVTTPISGSTPTTDCFFDALSKDADGNYLHTVGILSESGTARAYNKSAGSWSIINNFGKRMKTLQCFSTGGVPCRVFVGGSGVFAYQSNTLTKAEHISSALPIACAFKDRLFCAVDPYTVAYSAALDYTNFADSIDDGGKIKFTSDKGEIVALLRFCDAVYIFYERGIRRLEVAGKARDLKIEQVEYDGGRIFGESVAVCSGSKDKAFFLAESGLYAFDGKHAKPVCESLSIQPTRTKQICKCAVAEHIYTVQYVDRTGKERRIVVNGENETGYDSFVVEGLSSVRGTLVCRYEGEPYAIRVDSPTGELPTNERFFFYADGVDFGCDGDKRLQSLECFGDGEITLSVASEKRTKTKRLVFVGGRASMRLWMKGKRFSISVSLEKGAKLQAVVAEILQG